MIRRYLFIASLLVASICHAQTGDETGLPVSGTVDTVPVFTLESAINYVQQVSMDRSIWRSKGDEYQKALLRLLRQTAEPYDSVTALLHQMDLRSIPLSLEKVPYSDSLKIRWLNDTTFIVDTVGWSLGLILKEEMRLKYPVDFSTLTLSDSILDENGMLDSTLFIADTLLVTSIDTFALEALHISMHSYQRNRISPPVRSKGYHGKSYISRDMGYVVFVDTSYRWIAADHSPFLLLPGRFHLDSLQYAVETLLEFTEGRDSTRLMIDDIYGRKTPFWVTTGDMESTRFWVKNYKNDSITLWIGNPAPNEISLLLEDDIDVNRMMIAQTEHLPRQLREPDQSLAEISMLEPVPIFWDKELTSAFSLSQTYLSNWTKGGESSLTTMFDVTGLAIYNNTTANTQWINSIRLQFGTLATKEKGFRKNNDLFEINSKFNRNASGKIGMSASFYMKSQVAKGYNYPNDSVVESKFLNPASLTIGLGVEYKPFKHTTLNLAPLSYKNTFVLDTALVDQTRHGIASTKKAKQELGTQVVLFNTFSPMEDLSITNRLRLFSNYLNHPENIDVDWEMLLDKKINWFFTIRLNLHLIYDDDVRFPLFDSNDQPVMMPDGSQKKVARSQFKEFVGLSMLFKL